MFKFEIEIIDFEKITLNDLQFFKCMRLFFCFHLSKSFAKVYKELINILFKRFFTIYHTFSHDKIIFFEFHIIIAR